jgi:Uma2 family endonuclease
METMLESEEEISDYQRERGKPMPSFEHSEAQLSLIAQILPYADYKPLPELNLNLGGVKSVPDIAVYEKKITHTFKGMVWITTPPLLAIEILSPSQGLKSLFDKAAQYLQHGVEEAWIVIPEIQSITVCKPDGSQKTFVEGAITHGSTGITVEIDKVFH